MHIWYEFSMDLKRIRSFAAVAKDVNVSRAAERLHISQPALTRQLHALQADLGVALLERAGRGIRLTPAGEALAPLCQELLSRSEGLREAARGFAANPISVLRVAVTPHFIESLLAPVLGELHSAHPNVEIQLVESPSARHRDLLEHHEADMALGVTRYGEPLRTRVLPSLPLLVVAAAGHPITKRRSVELSALAAEPLLVVHRDFSTGLMLESACHIAQISPVLRHISTSVQTLLALAEIGFGVAVVQANARIETRAVEIATLCHKGEPIRMTVRAVWNPFVPLPAAAEHLIDLLERYMQAHPRLGSRAR